MKKSRYECTPFPKKQKAHTIKDKGGGHEKDLVTKDGKAP